MKKRYAIVGILLFLSAFVIFDNVTAQEQAEEIKYESPDGGIQISPTKFIWTLQDGETKSAKINVKNYSEVAQDVHVEVEDFYVGEDGSQPNFYIPNDDDPRKARDVREWITLPEDFTLEPNEAKWVEFTVSVPQDQPTNGYYGGILFRTGGVTGEEEGAHIGISYRVGALLIMAVQGDEPMKIDAKLNKFYAEESVFWDSPAILYAEIENIGNIHFPMFGKLEITRFGKKFHERELAPQLIYPDIPRMYKEKIMFGTWDFGRYNAHLTMWSEDETVQLSSDTTFYIIPRAGIGFIVLGLIILTIVIILFKKYVHIGKKPTK